MVRRRGAEGWALARRAKWATRARLGEVGQVGEGGGVGVSACGLAARVRLGRPLAQPQPEDEGEQRAPRVP